MNIKSIFSIIRVGLVENKKYTLYYFIIAFFFLAMGLIMPYISGTYVDRLVTDANMSVIRAFVIIFAITYLVQSAVNLFWSMINSLFCNTFYYHMIIRPVKHIMKSRFSKYHNMDTAMLVDQLRNDGYSFLVFLQGLLSVLIGTITIIASIAMLFVINIQIGVLIFLALPLYFLLYMGFRNKMYAADKDFKEKTNVYFAKRNEQLNRMAFIKRNELSNELGERVDVAFKSYISKNLRLNIISYYFENAGALTSALFHIIVIGFGGYHVISGNISIGAFTMITLYFNMIVRNLSEFFGFASTYQGVKVSTERMNEIYQNPVNDNGENKLDNIDSLEIRNLSLNYGEKNVFSSINKRFESGKIYAICGENGSGKSSLINCIMGLFYDLTQGDILFNKLPMASVDMVHLRRNGISYVEQSPEFLTMSINEYLHFGIDDTEETRKNRQDLIDAFGLAKFDFEDTITESGSNYSGGEKQKFSIARALSKDCAIAILDEPTSALDSDSVDVLVDVLKSKKANRITLVISHDSRLLNLCDEKWFII